MKNNQLLKAAWQQVNKSCYRLAKSVVLLTLLNVGVVQANPTHDRKNQTVQNANPEQARIIVKGHVENNEGKWCIEVFVQH